MQQNMPQEINQQTLMQAVLRLQSQLKSGANWFYWVAGLSLINSLILLFGGKWSFIIGLGITQMVDGIAGAIANDANARASLILKLVAFFVDLVVAGIFVLFGVFANKGYKWSFIIGMILYALDGLIFLLVQDWLSIGFHLFALYSVYSGLRALGQLKSLEQAIAADPNIAPQP
jgi:hypothetical protein